jgi:hypothetical protein
MHGLQPGGQRFGAACDLAPRGGQRQNLPCHRRLLGTVLVERDLDIDLALEGTLDGHLRHRGFLRPVVEDDGHAVVRRPELDEDVEGVGGALHAAQFGHGHEHHVLCEVEQGERGVGDGDPEVDHDVPKRLAQNRDRAVDEVGRDLVRLFGPQRAWKDHRAAGVVEDRAEQDLIEGLLRDVGDARKAARRNQPGEQRGVRVREVEVEQQHFAGISPRKRADEVERDARAAGAALRRVNADHGRLLEQHPPRCLDARVTERGRALLR